MWCGTRARRVLRARPVAELDDVAAAALIRPRIPGSRCPSDARRARCAAPRIAVGDRSRASSGACAGRMRDPVGGSTVSGAAVRTVIHCIAGLDRQDEVADEFGALLQQDRVARLGGVQRGLKVATRGDVDGRGVNWPGRAEQHRREGAGTRPRRFVTINAPAGFWRKEDGRAAGAARHGRDRNSGAPRADGAETPSDSLCGEREREGAGSARLDRFVSRLQDRDFRSCGRDSRSRLAAARAGESDQQRPRRTRPACASGLRGTRCHASGGAGRASFAGRLSIASLACRISTAPIEAALRTIRAMSSSGR